MRTVNILPIHVTVSQRTFCSKGGSMRLGKGTNHVACGCDIFFLITKRRRVICMYYDAFIVLM